MSNQFMQPFQPIRESTSPAFRASGDSTAAVFGLEASAPNAQGATNVRKWDYPTSRCIRLAQISGNDYFVVLGSSLAVAAADGTSTLVLGGTAEILRVQPGQNSISIVSTTDYEVNITLGYGQ